MADKKLQQLNNTRTSVEAGDQIAIGGTDGLTYKANLNILRPYLLKTGTIAMSIASSLSGALKFDGVSSYSKSTYSGLYTILNNIIGTAFDVDANNFYLPDPSGRVLGIAGSGTGLSNRTLFQALGAELHHLSVNEMPNHGHSGSVSLPQGDQQYSNGGGNTLWGSSNNTSFGLSISSTGGNQPHNNMQPTFFAGKYLYIYF